MKRGTVIFIACLVLGLAGLGYYLQQRKSTFIASPYSVIPTDAGVVFEIINLPDFFETLVRNNQMIDELTLAS